MRREGRSDLKPSSATYWLNDLFIYNLKNKIPTDPVPCYENYTKSSSTPSQATEQEHVLLATSIGWQEWALIAFGVSDRKDLRNSFWNLFLFASSEASVCDHPYPRHQTGPGIQRTQAKMHPLPPCVVQSAGSLGFLEPSYPVGPPTALACVFLTPFLLQGSPAGEGRMLMEGA